MSEGKYDNPLKATFRGIADLYSKKTPSVALPLNPGLQGKTVLVTGASSGLGLATAKRLSLAGANVIMVVRSGIPERGEAIRKSTGNERVTMYHVDLLDFNSIKKLVEQLKLDGINIDILISNAAMVPLKSRKTPQGLEEMFMVNFLAPFYFINQLISDAIIAKDGSRIIIVSSESHRNPAGFDWEKFGKYHEYGMNETVARYGYFKLLLTTFGNELSRRLKANGKNIQVKLLCPGPVNSNIAREAPGWLQPLLKGVFSLFFRSPEKASDPIMYFATAKEEEVASCPYLFLLQPKAMDEKATSPENGKILWEKSKKLINELGY